MAAIGSLPKGLQGSEGAVAETVENNVRKTILRDHLIDPAFFDEMSKLLAALIKARKENAITYAEYLLKIEELAQQVNEGKGDDTPDLLVTSAQRALYNNLDKDVDLAMQIDKVINAEKRDGWRDNLAKQREIKKAIYDTFRTHYELALGKEVASNPPWPSKIKNKVESVFDIVREQKEY